MANITGPTVFPNHDLSLAVTASVYHDIQHFLFREALLLDHRRFDAWLGMLANDVIFRIPRRFAHEIGFEPADGSGFLHDDRQALEARIKVLLSNEPSATGSLPVIAQSRRIITNVIVCLRARDEYDVLSYLLLTRTAPGEAQSRVFSAERHDHLRGSGHKLRIVRREIVMDQSNANVGIDMYL